MQVIKKAKLQNVLLKSFGVWLVIIFAEILHGTARIVWLEPVVGDLRARQISVFTASVIILAIVISLIKWIGAKTIPQLLAVGGFWLFLTIGFEILFGLLVMQVSWQRIASDYNLLQGGLMPIGLLFLALSPLIAAKIRRVSML